jgi:predicted negative regulator of RcsB-dependent stress response
VILGLALGAALLFGWRGWQTYTQSKAEQASHTYEQVLALITQNQSQQAGETAQSLLGEQPGSAYAALTALLLAGDDIKRNQPDAAVARLDWVMQNAKLAELQQLAKLRKARILSAKADYEGALALLQGDPGSFKAAYRELAGDIHAARKQPEQARQAYNEALAEQNLDGSQRRWVQMKLDDLGPAEHGEIVAAAFSQPAAAEGTPVETAPATPESAPTEASPASPSSQP